MPSKKRTAPGPQMLFQLVDGKPVPACPWRWERHAEVPDGRELLSLHDAAAIAGGSVYDLTIPWLMRWSLNLSAAEHREIRSAEETSIEIVRGRASGNGAGARRLSRSDR